jgi:2-methylcitrate dehydratase PrpD
MSKPLHSGRAAEGGVMAAMAALEGVTGALDILDGERGFGNAMSRDVDWVGAVAGLGEEWTITSMTQKNHSACGHMHAAIDAVAEMVNKHSIDAAKVREIRVGSYQKSLEICGNADPQTPYEAKFSMAYCLGHALLTGGGCRMTAFEPHRLHDAALRVEMAKVVHTIDDGCEAAFPRARSAKVEIELADGTVHAHHAPTRKGDPDAPLSDGELDEKFNDLAIMVMSAANAATLLGGLHRLDQMASLADLKLVALETPTAQAAE